LHVVAVIIFGTIKFVSDVLREETVFEAAPIETPPQQEKEYQVNIQQRNQSVPPPQPPAIVVNNPSEMDIPALDIDVNVDSTSVYGRSAGGFGGGIEGIRDMAISANLFGKSVSAGKLGVILDVSFSTHNVLNYVIEEIQASFPDALIVFAPGCGIRDQESVIVPIDDYEDTSEEAKYNYGGGYHLVRFMGGLLKKDDFKQLWDRAARQNRGYAAFVDLKGGDRGLAGCDVAMEFLTDEGADVIYWFADFNDRVDAELAEDVARKMRRRDTKLMIHDFKGGLGKGHNKETLEMMARKTRGEFFLKLLDDKGN